MTAVIGGTGYIGSYLCKHLPAVADPDDLSEFKVIIYMAGISRRKDCSDMDHTLKINVDKVIQTVSCKVSRDALFIYASTGAIYSACSVDMATEDTPVDPEKMDNYTRSMYERERALERVDVRTVGLRLAGVAGESPVMRNDLIYNAMMIANEIRVENPDTVRGVLWLHDLLQAIQTVIREQDKLNKHEIFNICSYHTTILEMAKSVSAITGAPYKIYYNEKAAPGFSMNCQKMSNLSSIP